MIIGFAGMTHLGQVMAQATEERGFRVIRYGDPIKVGDEPGLKEYKSYELDDLKNCDIIYVSLDTPVDGKGNINLVPVRQLINNVVTVLSPSAILVILSQVPPGFTRSIQYPRLYCQMDTLIRKKALHRATKPERIVIGCSDPKVFDLRYQKLLSRFDCPILRMNYESVELAKMAINYYLATDIIASNILSKIADKVGANWEDIIPALRTDYRIGNSYVLPGELGDHLQRDVVTVSALI